MPSRPSKKAKPQPAAKPGADGGSAEDSKASRERHRERGAKAILGKFQGRKSV